MAERDPNLLDQIDEEELWEEIEGADRAPRRATPEDLVRKYSSQDGRILVQRNDFLIPNILSMIDNREVMDLAPQYQRRYRWNNRKRSQLIESLLLNIPIPPIFLYETDYARYEVMDGQQRLSTIKLFFGNSFKLNQLTEWPELNGKYFRDLPSQIQNGLRRRGLAAVIILTESGQNKETAMRLRQYVFERLNTGGQPLNAQEVRNCLFAGPFNDLLIDLSRCPEFTQAWDIPPREPDEPYQISRLLERNRLYSYMLDCEIVLRFFAFRDLSFFSSGVKRTLDATMNRFLNVTQGWIDDERANYLAILRLALGIYGAALFRLPDESGELSGRRSVAFADAVLVGLQFNLGKAQHLLAKAKEIRQQTKLLLEDEESYALIVGRGNTKSETESRIRLMANLFETI